MFGGGFVTFVFHLEHDADNFIAVIISFAVDIVAFTTGSGIVIFFEISILKASCAQFIELGFAVLFQCLAHHLG
ncbi:hypothetical protein D3C79_1009190 [compost metagenome]